jgi:putative chitinase
MITREQLSQMTASPDRWLVPINNAMQLFAIDTEQRQAHFLAQVAHESLGFTHLEENLDYGPAGLLSTFPTHFTPTDAVSYAHDPRRIANRAYANRLGNGDEASGDGWEFRGRGLIQLTGRGMYRRAGEGLGVKLEDAPDTLTEPLPAALSAAWFWRQAGCNELADLGLFLDITRKINGGLNGVEDRHAWLTKAETALA